MCKNPQTEVGYDILSNCLFDLIPPVKHAAENNLDCICSSIGLYEEPSRYGDSLSVAFPRIACEFLLAYGLDSTFNLSTVRVASSYEYQNDFVKFDECVYNIS